MNTFDFNPYKALKSLLEVTAPHLGNEFLKVVCEELKILFDADVVFTTEALDFNPTTKVRILYSTAGITCEMDLEGTPCRLVFQDKIIQISKDASLLYNLGKGSTFESFYGIPIHDSKDNCCIGHIAILSNKRRELPVEVEDIALIFARRIEAEYERIILEKEKDEAVKKLYDLTIIDPLTQLYNRRFFMKKGEEVFTQIKRDLTKASMIFLDLDNFKKINDNLGHSTGDFVLKEIGNILKNLTRNDIDFIARVGGEEFTIISLNSDINSSIKLAQRIMEETEAFFKQKDLTVTFSIGIAIFDKKYSSWEEIYTIADEKMYQSKTNGKNRITF